LKIAEKDGECADKLKKRINKKKKKAKTRLFGLTLFIELIIKEGN